MYSLLFLALTIGQVPRIAVQENVALAFAVADLRAQDESARPFLRYVWVQHGVWEEVQATGLAANYLSVSRRLKMPAVLGAGTMRLARVDLRDYAGRSHEDLVRLVRFWEEFRFDPKFNLLITAATLQFLDIQPPKVKKTVTEKVKVKVAPYKWTDGNTYDWKMETVTKVVEVPFAESGLDVVRVPGEHIDLLLYEEARALTGSEAPVVSHAYWMWRALSTIKYDGDKDTQLFKTVYGGLYYELAGVPLAGKEGTDLDALLESLGVGNVKAGLTADKLFARLRSDQRSVVTKSLVTGKPRRVEFLPTLMTLDQVSFVSITSDFRNRDIDIDTDVVMNLLDFTSKIKPVHEVIWVRANGLHGFSLYNGAQKLQQSVPEDVAADRTVPEPHTVELEGAVGCIACHAKERGWRRAPNGVRELVKKVDIPGDKRLSPDEVDRILGLYDGDLEAELLPSARDAYARAVLRVTGPWKESKNQLNLVELASDRIAKTIRDRKTTLVDATFALRDLGFPAKDKLEDNVATLNALLPPVNVVRGGFIPEDPRLALLKAGQGITVYQWDLVYSFASARAHRAKGNLEKK